jgi:hypothetical protein
MRRPPFWLVALPGLLLATIVAVAALAGVGRSPVYSAAAVQTGLARDPQAWVGRTVRVRSVAVAAGCFVATESDLALCAPLRPWLHDADPGAAPTRMPLTWAGADPLPTFLCRVPLLSRLVPAPQAIQWDVVATYRVRLQALPSALCSTTCYKAVVLDGQP